MAKTQDFNTALTDIMGAFPVDTAIFGEVFKSTASLSEKLSGVALSAAEQSAAISSKWTQDTISKLGNIATAKAEPADYANAVTEFASTSAEVAAENLAAFAEIAKKVQMDTVEMMMAASKDATENASAAVQKATNDVTAAAKSVAAK